MTNEIIPKNWRLDSKLLAELNKLITEDRIRKMGELGFVSPEGEYHCLHKKYLNLSPNHIKEDSNRVKCPLYINPCMIYSTEFGLRPCVALYNQLNR